MRRSLRATALALGLVVGLGTGPATAQTTSATLYSITGNPLFDQDGNPITFLKRLHPTTGGTLGSLQIVMVNPPPPIAPGDHRNEFVVSGNGLATHPQTGQLWAILSVQSDVETNVIKRHLATIDPLTGQATLVRDIGRFAGLAFTTGGALGAGVLLGVTADGEANGTFCPPQPQCPGSTLFRLLDNGSVALVKDFDTIADGESIAFNSTDLRIYHSSGGGQLRFFESFDLSNPPTAPTTRIPLNGASSDQITALTFLRPSFLGASQSRDFLAVAFFGAVTKLGPMDHQSNGLAFVTPPAATTLAAAVLPSSRAVQLPAPATAFATVVNTGSNPALNVGMLFAGALPPAPKTVPNIGLTFSETDCATNAVVGDPDVPVASIAPGDRACYVVALTPTTEFEPFEVALAFSGVNTADAPTLAGVNSLLLSALSTPGPDPLALAATPSGDGVHIPGAGATGAFAMATANVGATGFVTVVPSPSSPSLPVELTVCQTSPTNGACVAAPKPSVISPMQGGSTATFAVFVKATGSIAPNAATNRISVLLQDAAAITRGRTSVAVQTQ